jgi:cysteinyl-tRNA synthetase
MTLKLYNTLARKKVLFVPANPSQVGIYVCGVTVWDATHLGHARSAITFDLVVRVLRARGMRVTYVRNFTDVDDKIIARATQENVEWHEIAQRYMAEYREGLALLGNVVPEEEPCASDHIGEMIAMIEQLISKDMAYVSQGDVFFAVRKFSGYGKLSGKKIEELEVGARIEANASKRDPLDFALWKAVKPGEPSWESPWGPGRPGWHIECSAMALKYLEQPIDIHGGGCDVMFPHHENEIAQAEGATGQPFVSVWLHNGSLTVDAEKMSKSLGNYFRLTEALQRFDAEVLRYYLLALHYRSPLDFTEVGIADAGKALTRFYEATARLGAATVGAFPAAPPKDRPKAAKPVIQRLLTLRDDVLAALADDLNTPQLNGIIFDVVRELNRYLNTGTCDGPAHGWIQMAWSHTRNMLHDILGFYGSDPAVFRERMGQRQLAASGVNRDEVEQLLAQRASARAAKDFGTADSIRDQLTAMGVTFQDRPDGTTDWQMT